MDGGLTGNKPDDEFYQGMVYLKKQVFPELFLTGGMEADSADEPTNVVEDSETAEHTHSNETDSGQPWSSNASLPILSPFDQFACANIEKRQNLDDPMLKVSEDMEEALEQVRQQAQADQISYAEISYKLFESVPDDQEIACFTSLSEGIEELKTKLPSNQ